MHWSSHQGPPGTTHLPRRREQQSTDLAQKVPVASAVIQSPHGYKHTSAKRRFPQVQTSRCSAWWRGSKHICSSCGHTEHPVRRAAGGADETSSCANVHAAYQSYHPQAIYITTKSASRKASWRSSIGAHLHRRVASMRNLMANRAVRPSAAFCLAEWVAIRETDHLHCRSDRLPLRK